jgi:mRNA interferase RelE/StbE
LSAEFQIAETETFQKRASSNLEVSGYQKIAAYVYPQLGRNPFFGPNIKKLKGEFEGIYRYRIGDRRLFYSVDVARRIVFILDIQARKEAYRKKR